MSVNTKLEKASEQEATLRRAAVWMLGVVTVILVTAALRSTALVSSTVAIAFFAALATWPADEAVRNRVSGSAQWLGHLAAMGLILLVFGLFLGGLVLAARQIIGTLPQYESVAERWIDRLAELSQGPGLDTNGMAVTDQLINPVMGFASMVVQSTSSLAGILSLIFFMVLLMLVEAPRFAAKLKAATVSGNGDAYQHVLLAIAERVRRYLAVRTFLGAATAMFYMGWSWAWGLDFIFVWALLAFLFNYAPTIGSFMAGVPPIAMAFLQLGPWPAALYAGGVILFEQIMGNYVDPKMQGRQLALSPLAILISLLFWSWVWGVAGALVAVPMTLVLLIVCERIDALRPFALFLSNCRDMEELKSSLEDR